MTPVTVAAFDVDGTLTRRDTFLPFCLRVFGRRRVASALTRAGLVSRQHDGAKAWIVRALFAGRAVAPLAAQAEDFADDVLTRRLRPGAAARVRAHRDRGHRVVLVSASPTLYLDPVATRLGGLDANLSTVLEIDDGHFTGHLAGLNCRGPEKAARLRRWLAAEGLHRGDVRVIAYGDSSGDRELLGAADIPVWVRRDRDLAVPVPA